MAFRKTGHFCHQSFKKDRVSRKINKMVSIVRFVLDKLADHFEVRQKVADYLRVSYMSSSHKLVSTVCYEVISVADNKKVLGHRLVELNTFNCQEFNK